MQLNDFLITKKWPAQHPERIQLYSLPTPNGVKVSIMLEECNLAYEAHRIDIMQGDQMTPEFLSLNPNNKIPALIDPNGPDGQAISLWESGAILQYLAEKTGLFLSKVPSERYQTLQWLMWQMGGLGPMSGQFGFFFKAGGSAFEDKRPLERYQAETLRLLKVLNQQLQQTPYVAGQSYSIADIAIWPWINVHHGYYGSSEALQLSSFTHIDRWFREISARVAVQKAVEIPAA